MPDAAGNERRFRDSWTARLALLLAASGLAFGVAELVLRARGVEPGYVPRYSGKSFRRVDRLVVQEPYRTGEDGVYRANPTWPGWKRLTEINSEGFRGPEFRRVEGEGESVLFLGDSFTWGIAAQPLTDSFVDRVDRAGYVTYNAGISRTHPKQYATLAARLVPRLKPDVVAVMFYMGNDLNDAPPMEPGRNIYHRTTAGDLNAYRDDGEWMEPEVAYRHYLDRSNAVRVPPGDDRSFGAAVRRGLLATAFGTQVLAVVDPNEAASAPAPAGEEARKARRRRQVDARAFLSAIRDVATRHGARFRLFLIPVRPERVNAANDVARNLGLFKGFDPLVADIEFTAADYEPLPGWHWNSAGHGRYAEYILRVLRAGE